MTKTLLSAFKIILLLALVLAAVFFAGRVAITQRSSPLQLWHTFVPTELDAQQIDRASWSAYIQRENDTMDEVQAAVSRQVPAEARTTANRYFDGSPMHPSHFKPDWNRSFILKPEGKPVGAVVLLHGLTDSPYSVRTLARSYAAKGFIAVAPRLPGHGTVPAGLTSAVWEDWMATARMAAREALTHIGAGQPLHVVGYSNGGALAMKYALEAIDNPQLRKPDRVVLLSPMIGVTRFARFAGLAGLPAVFPAFAQAAWLGVDPEFNPFKYNSFPVNGARQSYRLSSALQEHIAQLEQRGALKDMPPVQTFQSVLDHTVSTQAILTSLYDKLPANGSEIVLFDVNRSVKFGPLMRTSSDTALEQLLPAPPKRYTVSVVTNARPDDTAAVERRTIAGEVEAQTTALDQPYPPTIFSLSHIAMPFPMDDPLYGVEPTSNEYGVNLGSIVARGERGALLLSMDGLYRLSANPFYPYMMKKIEANIGAPATPVPAKALALPASTAAGKPAPQLQDDKPTLTP